MNEFGSNLREKKMQNKIRQILEKIRKNVGGQQRTKERERCEMNTTCFYALFSLFFVAEVNSRM
jgi:hypothetical protein